MHFAALDLGSNTVATLVQENTAAGLTFKVEHAECTRLGENLAQTGRLSPAAMRRSLDVARQQCQMLRRDFSPLVLTAVGTSAVREAANGQEFLQLCQQELPLLSAPLLLSEADEANLTFRGASSSFSASTLVCNFDVGGASTEVSIGFPGDLRLSCSLPAGCVRWRDRFGLSETFGDLEITAASLAARSLFRPYLSSFQSVISFFGSSLVVTVTGGTGTGLGAVRECVSDSSLSLHGGIFSVFELQSWLCRLSSLPSGARESLPGLSPGRGSVLPAGLIILLALLEELSLPEVMVNRHGLRHGLIAALQAQETTLPINQQWL